MSLNSIIETKIVKPLKEFLRNDGFIYSKVDKIFEKTENGITYQIALKIDKKFYYYDNNYQKVFHDIEVQFRLYFSGYENWHYEKLKKKVYSNRHISSVNIYFEVLPNEIPSIGQKTSEQIFQFLKENRRGTISNSFSIDDFKESKFSSLMEELRKKSDVLNYYNEIKMFANTHKILLWRDYQELGLSIIDSRYNLLINLIDECLQKNENPKDLIMNLDLLVNETFCLTGKEYHNPHYQKIKLEKNKNFTYQFTDKIVFKEELRLDISEFQIYNFEVNSKGEILLLLNTYEFIKLDIEGKIVLKSEIPVREGFDPSLFEILIGNIPGTEMFFLNNYILTENNKLIEYQIPLLKPKQNKLPTAKIVDFAYDSEIEKVYYLYQSYLLIYSKSGLLEKKVEFKDGQPKKIILDKNWVLCQVENKYNKIYDFSANLIGVYTFSKGNRKFVFSKNYEYLLCYGYDTKSQLHKTDESFSKSIMVHQTYLDGYKQKMSDVYIENNYHILYADFSPDSTLLICGSTCSANVVFDLANLQMTDMLPSNEAVKCMIDLRSDSNSQFLDFNDKTFFRAKGYDLDNVIFLHNENLFVTCQGLMMFLWDNNYNCLKSFETNGRIKFFHQKYLIDFNFYKNELILYKCY